MRSKPMATQHPQIGDYVQDGARIALWAFLCLSTTVFVVYIALSVAFPYPLDYGEGPLLDQAIRLARLRNIYRRDLSAPPYTVSNYPPLYVLALTPWVWIFGPVFTPGRLLSSACGIAGALLLGVLVDTHTEQRNTAWLAGLLFLAFPYVVQWTPLLRVDMLALALSLGALVALSRWRQHPKGWLAAALLLVAAVYTRQSYGLAAPLAAFVWLWVKDGWRPALRLAVTVGGLGLALLALLTAVTGGGFVFNVITANVNTFEMDTLLDWASRLLSTAPILVLMGGVLLLFGFRRAPMAPLVLPYLVGATVSGATIGKVGSNVNYLLELSAALCLTAASLVSWIRSSGTPKDGADPRASLWQPWIAAVVQVALAIQVGLLVHETLTDPVNGLKWRLKPRQEIDRLALAVEMAEGPVLADEFMGLLALQNRQLYLQPFELTQLARAGLWDPSPLVEEITDQTFPLIMVHHFPDWPVYKTRWTPEMLEAIKWAYVAVDFAADTVVFQPKPEAEVTPTADTVCPGAVWALPTSAEFGMWWFTKELWFLGEGYDGEVAVRAVADGALLRRETWEDALAIRHQDPLDPERQIWTFYADMMNIPEEWAPGSSGVQVDRGSTLGYQSRRSASGPVWPHVRFAILPALEDGGFPAALVGYADETDAPLPVAIAEIGALNPSPYLGTVRSQVMGTLVWLPSRCEPKGTVAPTASTEP
ncbi:MAG: glycosyltransferase family 39 protein [Anaerolineae bacterium]|nr:glycosyltransferase family 39 protein [Anaerolineae bacterium]